MRKIASILLLALFCGTMFSCREKKEEKETIVIEKEADEDKGILERAGEEVDEEVNEEIDEAIEDIGDDN